MKDEYFKILKFALGASYGDRRIWHLIKQYYEKYNIVDESYQQGQFKPD